MVLYLTVTGMVAGWEKETWNTMSAVPASGSSRYESDTYTQRWSSSSTIVAFPCVSPRGSATGEDRLRVNESLFSTTVSPVVLTVTVLVVSLGRNVSVVRGAAV